MPYLSVEIVTDKLPQAKISIPQVVSVAEQTGLSLTWSKPSIYVNLLVYQLSMLTRGRSGSVVECLTRDRRAGGSSLTGVTALWSLSKTHLS